MLAAMKGGHGHLCVYFCMRVGWGRDGSNLDVRESTREALQSKRALIVHHILKNDGCTCFSTKGYLPIATVRMILIGFCHPRRFATLR